MKRTILVGSAAGLMLLAVYFGIVTLAQGFVHAVEQAATLWYWLLALSTGFGVQAGIFDSIRRRLKEQRAAAASITTSGGVSAGSMVACCAHHLSDALPLLGLAGLAAFLANYQLFFIILGVMSNAVGIAIMLEVMQRNNLSPTLARLPFGMGRLKKATMILSGIIILVTSLVTISTSKEL